VQLEAEFSSKNDAPQRARDLIRSQLVDCVPAATLADVLTLVSELVANAATHGDGSEARVRVGLRGDSVVGEVENDGYGEVGYEVPDPQDLQGLGLHIVDAVATTWDVEYRDGPVTVVSFEVVFP
jgi:anti-sigma regulatory factor (Ser/Thr protein kinase)